MSAGACSRGHAREASEWLASTSNSRPPLFLSSLGERRTRSASEGKELLASEFAAGIGPRDAKLAAAAILACTVAAPKSLGRHHPVYR